VLAAFEPAARAQDIGELTAPGSSITVGAGYVSGNEKDRARFGMGGAGTTTPTLNLLAAPGTGQALNLELKRKSITLGGDKWLTDTLQVEVNFKNEDKDGGRQFGRGFACSAQWQAAGVCTGTTQSALLFLVEPVNSNIKQLDAKLNWRSGKLRLSGGYYGSFYTNSNGTLTPTVPGTVVDMNGTRQAIDAGLRNYLSTPMALWPDNQSH